MDKATLDDLTGYLGVGALEMFGAFLIVDGFADLIDWLLALNAPQSLAIVTALPLLVICYVVGLLTSTSMQVGVDLIVKRRSEQSLLAEAAVSTEPSVVKHLEAVERHSRLLHGCAFAFLVVAAGCISEKHQLDPELHFVGNACAAIGGLIAVVCVPLARKLEADFSRWFTLVEQRMAVQAAEAGARKQESKV